MKKLMLKESRRKSAFGGWVLFGRTPGVTRRFRGHTTDWLERWFPTAAKAERYAEKLGYEVERIES